MTFATRRVALRSSWLASRYAFAAAPTFVSISPSDLQSSSESRASCITIPLEPCRQGVSKRPSLVTSCQSPHERGLFFLFKPVPTIYVRTPPTDALERQLCASLGQRPPSFLSGPSRYSSRRVAPPAYTAALGHFGATSWRAFVKEPLSVCHHRWRGSAGALGGPRSHDLRLRRSTLYLSELQALGGGPGS